MTITNHRIIVITIYIMAILSNQACTKNIQEPLMSGSAARANFPMSTQVKLGFCGDINVNSEQLTKGAYDGHLYGIQVYYDKEKDGVTDDYYGYGLFDNVADMVISVLNGYKYRFVCSSVLNGKTSLYYGQYAGNTFTGYAKPFQTNTYASTMLSNKFILGSDTYFTGLGCGIATIKTSNGSSIDQNWPAVERYYGELDGYSPITPCQNVTISMKKCYYAVRFILKGIEYGTLTAAITYPNPGGTESFSTTSKDFDTGVLIRSFYDVSNCSNIIANIDWSFTSTIFNQWNITGNKVITLKRNTLTTVTVSVTPDSSGGSIGIVEESFDNANNINLFLNSDGVIDIYVNPTEEDD